MKNYKKQLKCAVLSVALSSFIYSNANAGGYSTNLYSTSGLGNSYAGSSTGAHDVSDTFFNPAVTAGIKKNEAILSVSYLNLRIDPDNMTGANALGSTNGQDLDNVGTQKLIPAFYLSSPVNDKVSLNFALTSPFGLETRYTDGWSGRYRGLKSSIKTINLNPSIAYKLTDDLSVGAGFVGQYYTAKLTKKGFDGSIYGIGSMEGSDWGYGYNLGATYKISDNTKIGLGYRSKIDHNLKGNINFETTYSRFKANTTTPESLSLGLSHNLSKDLQFVADSVWTRWSRLKQLKVNSQNSLLSSTSNYNWNDSFLYSVGANYNLDSSNLLRGGLAYEKESVNTRNREARIPASDKYWLTAGLNHKFGNDLEMDLAYVHQIYRTAKVNINDQGANNLEGTLYGKYKTSVDVISVALKKQF